MKVITTRKPTVPVFEPVTLTIVLETPQEVQAAYDLGDCSRAIRNTIQRMNAERHIHDVAADSAHELLVRSFYQPLQSLFGQIGAKGGRLI